MATVAGLVLGLGGGGLATAWGAEPPAGGPSSLASETEGLEACRRGLEAGPIDRHRAMCFYDVAAAQERWAEAREELEARVAEPGVSPMLLLPLATILAHQGELRRAVTLLGEALESMPDAGAGDRAVLLINRGQYLLMLG
ncbi:MAG: hypothetical protein KDK70_09350, partial [Myxococcales bacterium]|nr:hypothetical protein [Myxococcales bacterium]